MSITSVERIRQYLGLKPDADTDLLTSLVAAADAFVLSYLNIDNVEAADYVERYNGSGTTTLVPRHTPINSITKLTVNACAISAADLTDYPFKGYSFADKLIALYCHKFEKGVLNVELTYNAGFQTIPEDLAQAATYIASQMYRRKDRIGVSSKTIGQESISYSANDLDTTSRTILNEYKKKFLTP